MQDHQKRADNIIKEHTLYSMGLGIVPLPLVDFFGVIAVQLDMMHRLCEAYNVPYYEAQGKAAISALAGTSLARLGASLVKSIPLVGSILGGVSSAILSGASTYATGEVLKRHFEDGGTLDNLNADDFREYYAEQMERGKSVARAWQREEKQNANAPTPPPTEPKKTTIPIDKLKELADLKAAGVLTDEEFQMMKKKLLEDV
ncbi:MAG: SHOCT domain-containing protein [Saprospiraceae bacterium]